MAGEEELSSAGSLPPHLDLPHLCPLCQRRVAKVNSLTNPEPSAQCPYRDFAALLRCFFLQPCHAVFLQPCHAVFLQPCHAVFLVLPRCFFCTNSLKCIPAVQGKNTELIYLNYTIFGNFISTKK